MQYGLIGSVLSHSFSKEIHEKLKSNPYTLVELSSDEFEIFLKTRNFSAINVTMPYKTRVLPYLSHISEEAKAIGAVNTIVNRDGELWGYNTDFDGLCALIKHAKITLENKKVAILGTGGTSKTARAVAEFLGASRIFIVTREERDGCITYDDLRDTYNDVEIIINTTPVGMYPDSKSCPLDLFYYPRLKGVIDVIYNPLQPQLVLEAQRRGIKAEGGLYMLVAQAVRASELFLDCTYEEGTTERIYHELLSQTENIVLTGMPGAGKSTVGRILAEKLGREFLDLDEIIVQSAQRSISEIFATEGERGFRKVELRILYEHLFCVKNTVIATGGGSILLDENVDLLRRNGKIYFIDRPLEALVPTEDRPLAFSYEAIRRRYEERYDRYCATADYHINGEGTPQEVAERIRKEFLKL